MHTCHLFILLCLPESVVVELIERGSILYSYLLFSRFSQLKKMKNHFGFVKDLAGVYDYGFRFRSYLLPQAIYFETFILYL